MKRRKHQVPRQCRLHRRVRRLAVANLAHHHDVRVLAKHRPQRRGKRQTGRLVNLNLVDHLDLVLDGIFNRDEVQLRRTNHRQGRVKRGGLPAAGRSGDEHQPMRPREDFPHRSKQLLANAQVVQLEGNVPLIEDTHHDLLAQHRGQRRDADVNLSPFGLDLDAAVLRLASLGDVHFAHDLHAAHNRRVQIHPRAHQLLQPAVYPNANVYVRLARLDVNVAGLLLHGAEQDIVDQVHDRRRIAHLFQLREVVLVGILFDNLDLALFEAVQEYVQFDLRPVILLDRLLHQVGAAQNKLQTHAGDLLDVVDLENAQRPADRHRQGIMHLEHRADAVPRGRLLGQNVHDLRIDQAGAKVRIRDAQLQAERFEQVLLRHQAARDEDLAQRLARFALAVQRHPEIVLRKAPHLDEHIAETLADLRVRRHTHRAVLTCSRAGLASPSVRPSCVS